jgi:hypothetical protein
VNKKVLIKEVLSIFGYSLANTKLVLDCYCTAIGDPKLTELVGALVGANAKVVDYIKERTER